MPTVRVSGALSRLLPNSVDRFSVLGNTLDDVLSNIITEYPQLKPYLYASDGKLSHFISIYLNEKNVPSLQEQIVPISAEDEIEIVASLSGG